MRFARKLNTLYDAALALLYPQTCAVCDVRSVESYADSPACAACWQATSIFNEETLACWKCSAPLISPVKLSEAQKETLRCHACESDAFTAARAVGVYEEALRAAVLELKRKPFIGARLAGLLAEAQMQSPLDTATRIVPVPLAAEREQERGFNQAAIIARALAAHTCLPLDEWSLTRTVHTPIHRAGMDRQARRESVRDSFTVARPRLIDGERILLVDDVFTTGATASACASALRAAGAQDVLVLTLARAV